MTDSPESIERARLRTIRLLVRSLWGLVLVMALLVGGYFFASQNLAERADDLPIYQALPHFELTNRDGSTVTPATFAGKPWVADFVFTSCPGVCPVLSERMQTLAGEIDVAAVNFVSFSVDPATDTPEVLQAYAQRHDAGPNWYFLTGPEAALYSVVRDGFQLVLDPTPRQEGEGTEPIVHSNRFVLVDAEGRIRGYYNAFDEQELGQLRVDLAKLLD